MDKIKISNFQLFIITTGSVIGPTTISFSSSVTEHAHQDAWLSVIFAAFAGLPVLWINTYLGGLYPDKTFIEIIQLLLGRWIGGLFSANFIFMALLLATRYIWYIGDFFTKTYIPDLSAYTVNILFLAVIVIALLYSFEAVARALIIFFYVSIITFTLSIALVTPNMDINNLLPVMEQGILPVMKGSFPLLGYSILPLIFLNMIYPSHIKNIKKAKKAMLAGYFLAMLILFISIISCILVLGSTVTANTRMPVFLRSKVIDIGVFFSRLEAITIIDWLITIFGSTYIAFYSGVAGLSQLIKLKNYKNIVLPLGLIIGVVSGFVNANEPYQINWTSTVWPPYIFISGFILPVLLLILSLIKNQAVKKAKPAQTP
ncbi:spore germination protein KB [Ruminiclostridium sufflavum DSM 19573]|uniref:Spore germination protein KB n=1 Tax=Ruminiclostridium sufflavum DSM 19573 TaxID=1121337 RepID=A0A318YCK6_9FIRM|nr:endospore germination permease [Ruminiclostridium sufflavum]PYG90342.1 spore germination protein KB [Ruminiclostridium sufflavum DSM 19573]